MATVLKGQGYATGQFGKNHQGDRDEHLPTMHGFDEFFGNLYHLNAEEEPENEDYPKNPEFRKRFGPRGVIHSWADGKGGQKIEDTGPLTKKRMETVDEETSKAAMGFIEQQHKAGKPFFVWWNATRMHFRTHVKAENRGKSGQDEYSDGMVEHDAMVGELLKKLDELGIANDTVVMYSTDNGPHFNTWPDAGNTPFRSEKNSNWEGAYRVPAFVRWPGKFPAGVTLNGIVAHEDWLTTFAAIAGDTDVKERLLKGTTINGRSYRAHLDGYNQLDYLTGKSKVSPRNEFIYVNDDGQVVAHALPGLEVGVPGEPRPGLRRVARALRRIARAAAVQSASRSLRARAAQRKCLQRLAARPGVHPGAAERHRRQLPAQHEGLPAERDAGLVQSGQDPEDRSRPAWPASRASRAWRPPAYVCPASHTGER